MSQLALLRQGFWLRQNLEREESLPRNFFYFEMIFQKLKEKSSNSCRELPRLFQLSLARWIFPLPPPTFLLPHFKIYSLLFAPFCMESQSIIRLISSRSQVMFLRKLQRNSVIFALVILPTLQGRALPWPQEALRGWAASKSEYSSFAAGAEMRSQRRRSGCLCHCC